MANELNISFATASANLYAILRRTSDSKVWNGSSMETWADANIANYDVALADVGGDQYTADMPSSLPTGYNYRAYYYERAGGTPAITDLLLHRSPAFHWNGVVSTAASPGTAEWYYANQDDLEDAMGALNLTIASNQENTDTDTDTSRVQRAGELCDATIDARLYQFGYTTPLANMDDATVQLMKGISVNLVAYKLNVWRAVQSGDKRSHRALDLLMGDWMREARAQITRIGIGLEHISADFRSGQPEATESFSQFDTPFTLYSQRYRAWPWGW